MKLYYLFLVLTLSGSVLLGLGFVADALKSSFSTFWAGLIVFGIGLVGAIVTFIVARKKEAKKAADSK